MNKRFTVTAALMLTFVVLALGCRESNNPKSDATATQPATEASAPRFEDLLNRRFTLAEVNGKAFDIKEPAQRPDIEFNEGLQITGRVCNRFRGPAELNDGKLRAENLVSTMMLCVNPELNELERQFFAMLRDGADISLDGNDRLTLKQDGYTLVYEQAEAAR